MNTPRVPYNPFRDVEGREIHPGALVQQHGYAKQHGAQREREGQRARVLALRQPRVLVMFLSDGKVQTIVSCYLKIIPEVPPVTIAEIVAQLEALRPTDDVPPSP